MFRMVMLALAFSYHSLFDEGKLSKSSDSASLTVNKTHGELRVDIDHANSLEAGRAAQLEMAAKLEKTIREPEGGKTVSDEDPHTTATRDQGFVNVSSMPFKLSLGLWDARQNMLPDRKICQIGNVVILQGPSNERAMVHSSEIGNSVEAIMTCGPFSQQCERSCKPCRCIPNMESHSSLGTEINRVIYRHLAPLCKTKARVLLVGLGGSVLTQYLAHNCQEMKIDVFESNKAVVEAAQNFFGLQEAQALHKGDLSVLTIDTAAGLAQLASGGRTLAVSQGLKTGPGAYDAVVIDCFTGNGKIPDACRSRKSLEMVRIVLRPGGVVIQNAWGRSPTRSDVEPDFMALWSNYREVFAKSEDLYVPMPQAAIDFVHILKGTTAGPPSRDGGAIGGASHS